VPVERRRAARRSALGLRNWPVSRRLVALIVMALVMGLVFGGLRVADSADAAAGFVRTTQLAELGEQVTALAQALENEREIQVGLRAVVDVESSARESSALLSETAAANAALEPALLSAENATNVDAARVQVLAAQINSSFPANAEAKASTVVADIGDLPGLRSQMDYQPPDSALQAYSATIADLFDLNDQITSGSGDPVLAGQVRTLGWISRAMDEASQQGAILYAALLENSWSNIGGMQALTTAQGLETSDQLEFQQSASAPQESAFVDAVVGPEVDTAQLMNNDTSAVGQPDVIVRAANAAATPPQLWYASMSATIAKMRVIELQLAGAIVARSRQLEQGARYSEVLTAAVTAGVLLLVLLATIIVARSLVEPLRRLQADALEVATVRLPERVAELSEAADPQAAQQIEPISVDSTDEIGKVARAFDQVHREAIRLAGNEALLRGNLNTMFISLSRRSVPLIDRLARMIDSLEQNEDDPDRLSNLFSIDHLVTRMRRNSENLLVLAGEEPVRKWSEPVPLADVARAATSEIEDYSRVVLSVQPGIVVSGQAAADVVHLLAEIIENATMFSPQQTPVHVSGQELSRGGVLLEVRDSGVGVSSSRLAEMNWRLDNPPGIDVSVSRHMGLFAVSRLAERHGVRVRLRPVSPQGLSALVWLPGELTGGQDVARYYGSPGAARPDLLRGVAERLSGRHRNGLRTGEQLDQRGIAREAAVPAAPVSVWFRPKRSSADAGQQDVAASMVPPRAGAAAQNPAQAWSDAAWQSPGTDGWRGPDTGGRDIGQAAGWWREQADGTPAHGERSVAGLPTRIPQANLFPGSAGAHTAGGSSSGAPLTGYTGPASDGPARDGRDSEPLAFPAAAPPHRSAERARSRLSAFQLGSRDAQDSSPSAGEEANR
jgi:signal transduction histidine kinase